jgi:hypothetical protein
MSTWRWPRALTLVLPLALAAACATPAADEGAPPSSEPAREPPKPKPRDPWERPLLDVEAPPADCAAAARLALDNAAPARLGLRVVGGAAAIENDLAPAITADAAGPPCLLLVAAPEPLPPRPRRIVGREAVRSAHADGTRRVPNPEYRELRRALAEAERSGDEADTNVRWTGDPGVDLVGSLAELVVRGVDRLARDGDAAALRERLAATPETLEAPRSRAYRYELVEIDAARRGATRAALVDTRRGTVRAALSRAEERRRFRLAEGRRADDVADPPAGLQDLDGLDRWERAPPTFRLSTLLAHLLAVADERPGDAEGVLAAWRADATNVVDGAGPAPRLAAIDRGVVEVHGAGGAGAGFYIAPERVVTLARLVEGSDLARVGQAPGHDGLALVERRDPAQGLALLRVPMPGQPLELGRRGSGEGRAQAAFTGAGGATTLRGRLVVDTGSAGHRLYWQGDEGAAPPAGAAILAGDAVAAIAVESTALGTLAVPAPDIRAFLEPVVAARRAAQRRRRAASASTAQPARKDRPPNGVSQATGRGAPSARA